MKSKSSRIITQHITKLTINTVLPIFLMVYFIVGISRLIATTWLPANPLTILLVSLLITSATYNINFSLEEKGGVAGLIVSYIISTTLVFLFWPQVAIRVGFLKPTINWFEAMLLCLPARLYLVSAQLIKKGTDDIYNQIIDERFSRWGRIAIELARVSIDTWLPTALVTLFVFWFANTFTTIGIMIPTEAPRMFLTSIVATVISFDLRYTEYKVSKKKAASKIIAIIMSLIVTASIVMLLWPIIINGISYFQPINWITSLLLCLPARLYMLLSSIGTALTED